MNPADLKKIEKYQKEIARLQSGLQKLNRKLVGLPAKYGFRSMDEFIAALKRASRAQPTAATKGRKSRKRAVITDEVKQQVKSLLAAKKTGAEVARTVGISVPSVHNIKKELGLVKGRKK